MTDFVGGALYLSMQKACLDGWQRVRDNGREPVTLSPGQYDDLVKGYRHHESEHLGGAGCVAGLMASMQAMPLEVRKALAESMKANFMHAYAGKTVELGAGWDFNQPKEYAYLLGKLNSFIDNLHLDNGTPLPQSKPSSSNRS